MNFDNSRILILSTLVQKLTKKISKYDTQSILALEEIRNRAENLTYMKVILIFYLTGSLTIDNHASDM